MFKVIRTLLTLSLASTLAACALCGVPHSTQNTAEAITVRGALVYRERIALPPNSRVQITVSDIAIADRKAPVVAKKNIDLGNRQVPIAFELAVASDRLQPRRRYSLRGTISDPNGKLLWTTDTVHSVDPANTVNNLGVLRLTRVSQGGKGDMPVLTDKEWVVENIANGGIIDASRVTINLKPDGTIHGRASCNNYSGQYQVADETLQVRPLAVTRKACVSALNNQEQKFLRVLQTAAASPLMRQAS